MKSAKSSVHNFPPVKSTPLLTAAAILGLLTLCGLAFFWHLGSIGLVDETEPLFAEASRQMLRTGDWITPYFNRETRFDKPPLIYWLQAIAYGILGVNAWAVRLPSALAGLALTSFCFYTLLRFGAPIPSPAAPAPEESPNWQSQRFWTCAWIGAAIAALNLETILWARLGTTDLLLNACMGGALLAFFWGYVQPQRPRRQRRWYWLGYLLLGLAVLAKGPVGLVLPGLIIGSFSLYLGNFRQVFQELRLLRGMCILLVITLPWYLLVTLANGSTFINSFFGLHNLERFAEVVNQHTGPWYFYLGVILAGFAPWSVYLPSAIANLQLPRRSFWQQQPRRAHLGLLAGFWFLVILIFFTLATTKYFSYVLPLMPAGAILVALLSHPKTQARGTWHLQLSIVLNLGLFLGLAIASLYAPGWLSQDDTLPNLGRRIQQAGLPGMSALIWLGSAGLGLVLLLRRQTRWLWGVNLAAWLVFLGVVLIPALFVVDTERQQPLRQIAQTVVQVNRPGELLIMVGGFKKASLVFYSDRPVTYLADPATASPVLAQLIDQGSSSVLLVAAQPVFSEIGLEPEEYQPMTEAGVYQLVRVSSFD